MHLFSILIFISSHSVYNEDSQNFDDALDRVMSWSQFRKFITHFISFVCVDDFILTPFLHHSLIWITISESQHSTTSQQLLQPEIDNMISTLLPLTTPIADLIHLFPPQPFLDSSSSTLIQLRKFLLLQLLFLL